MFSRLFCGEGAPKFYVDKLKYAKDCNTNLISRFFGLVTACIPLSKHNWRYDEKGFPLIEDCVAGSFIDYHKCPELMSVYDSFFKNESGVLDAFVEFWKIVADKFKGRKNVLGYDLWNEPWASNLWTDLKSLIPGYVDNHILIDFYSKIDSGIAEIDPDYTMLFEPIPFPDTLPLFGGQALGTFSKTPVDNTIRKQMFNVHSYCCAADQNICKDGEPKLVDASGTCAEFHERKLKKNKQQANDIGIPIIVTEFGACSSSKACYYEMVGFEKAADKYLTSWAYWMFKSYHDHTTTAAENEEGIFNDDGTIQNMKEKALSRSYIQYFQGIPLEVFFNDETNEFLASFKYDKNINEPSVLYLNKDLNYKNGYILSITDENGKKIEEIVLEEKENYIYFNINRNTDEDLIVKVNVTPL
jgi:endoglycosylceramidase